LQVEAFSDTIGPDAPDERQTKNFEATSAVLLQLMTRGAKASGDVIEQLDAERAKSLWPGRRDRLLPPPVGLNPQHLAHTSTMQVQSDDLMS
jgi:hypothetical protein